ncbi:hypothetical protein GCM10017744_102700 [Streptomyces antimycoticus]|uniref:Uncharacterized protein n=1 Tax=Streptomyces antimycoticus TaxID=68175 RepID=A0A4D4KM89_9ACTN|nr:hypothetical protein [Streptomyces antimycoticus]GDY49304.1 hypothetical protein SANT12839_101860 [Streptomyces antimycoticus]
MTHTAQTKQPPASGTPSRSVAARRLTTRALSQIIRFSDPAATAAIAAMAILWITHTGPAWIATADEWTIVTYGIGIVAARVVLDVIAEGLSDLVDPDRWDGDIAYAIAEGLRQLRTDITEGADPDEVLDSLSTSDLVPQLLETLRALSTQYAARGDEDEKQRLLAAVLHLRHADQNIGYGPDQVAALHAATADETSLR